MSRLEEVKKLILEHTSKNGGKIGNTSLLSQLSALDVIAEEYWEAQKQLIADGALYPGRGKGGSVRLAESTLPSEPETEIAKSAPAEPSPNSLSKTEMRAYRKLLLSEVPIDGSNIGNKKLMGKLATKGLPKEYYWNERNLLIDEGVLALGQGQGGSVYLLKAREAKAQVKQAEKRWQKEQALYQPVSDQLKQAWIRDSGLDQYSTYVEITANKGKKSKPGKWTIPDITVVSVRSFTYVPGKALDVITFEIKPLSTALDVAGVFETAAHSRFAHKSYLGVHLPDGPPDSQSFKRLLRECERFGIGFLYFKKPDDWSTYETLVDPVRHLPAPEDVDGFIRTILTKDAHEMIHKLI